MTQITPLADVLMIRDRRDHRAFWLLARGWVPFEEASRITPDKEARYSLPPYGEWISPARAQAEMPEERGNNGESKEITPS